MLAREHLLSKKHIEDIVLFTKLIAITGQRYSQFRQMIENCDAQMFVVFPTLVVLYGLE